MDLIISYAWSHFYLAKPEAIRILQLFGEPAPYIEKTNVMGIAIAHTGLDNRDVIKRCRQLWHENPLESFEFATKWVPVDYWCSTDLDAMKRLIDENIKDQIDENQTWGMKVHKRRWQQYHTSEIIEHLAADIDRKVDLGNPDRIIWVDVIGPETAISLLSPEEIFSITRPGA
jgi:tRNA(Ser,Leu) C12 N-acetylase TAN1